MAFRKRSKSRQEQKADEGNGFDEGSSTSDLDSSDNVSDSSDNVSERLSDIDDAEISPYLLTKKEALYKTIIWEAMHKDYVEKRSTRKRARKAKEAGPRRKAAKTSTKQSDERHGNLAPEVKKGRSSKINYNAINEEDCRLEEGLESNEKVIGAEHSEEAQDGQGYYDDNYESEHQNQYNEEDESYYANDDGDDNGHNDGWF